MERRPVPFTTDMFIYKGKKVDERHTFRGKTIGLL